MDSNTLIQFTLTVAETNMVLQTLDNVLTNTPQFQLIKKLREQGEPQIAAAVQEEEKVTVSGTLSD